MFQQARGLLALALLAAGPSAVAQCAIDRPIRVAFYEFGINYDPATSGGRDLDLINDLSRRTGCRFEHVYDSRVRIWKQLEEGTLDMTVSAIDTPDREQFARFVLTSWDRDLILVHLKPGFPVTADEFLADRTLLAGAVKGYHYTAGIDEWVNSLRAQKRTYEAPDVATLMRVFDAGRVAAIPIEPEALPELTRRYHLAQPYQRVDWFAKSPKTAGGLALSRARLPEAVATQFHETMERMRRDGTLQRIGEKYMSPELVTEMLSPN
jgi:polar amino acid transport system substrate-binding protein